MNRTLTAVILLAISLTPVHAGETKLKAWGVTLGTTLGQVKKARPNLDLNNKVHSGRSIDKGIDLLSSKRMKGDPKGLNSVVFGFHNGRCCQISTLIAINKEDVEDFMKKVLAKYKDKEVLPSSRGAQTAFSDRTSIFYYTYTVSGKNFLNIRYTDDAALEPIENAEEAQDAKTKEQLINNL